MGKVPRSMEGLGLRFPPATVRAPCCLTVDQPTFASIRPAQTQSQQGPTRALFLGSLATGAAVKERHRVSINSTTAGAARQAASLDAAGNPTHWRIG